MKNILMIKNENNEILKVEILVSFKVDSINKEYIAYSINDDGVSDEVDVVIAEIKYKDSMPIVSPIREEEKEMVLLFYNAIKQ